MSHKRRGGVIKVQKKCHVLFEWHLISSCVVNCFFQEKERQKVKDVKIREMAMAQKKKMELQKNGMLKR